MDFKPVRPTFLALNSPLTNSRLAPSAPDFYPIKSSNLFSFNNPINKSSPTDSGIFSINSYDKNDRTPLTPSDISPFCERSFDFNKFSELKSPKQFTQSTISSPNRFLNPTIGSPVYKTSNKQSFFGSSLTGLSEPNEKLDSPYEFDPFIKSPVIEHVNPFSNNRRKKLNNFEPWPVAERNNLLNGGNRKFSNNFSTSPFDNKYEQCDKDCEACIQNDLKNSKTKYGDSEKCTQCLEEFNRFNNLMNLADKIYEANYRDITYNVESIVDLGTNLPIFIDTKFCRFCKNNKEKREIYLSHTTRNKAGETTCPVLMRYVCEECGATGKDAHTRSYCPISREAIKNDDLNVAMRCSNMNPVVKSQ